MTRGQLNLLISQTLYMPLPSSPPQHLPEPFELHDAGGQFTEGVEERHDLVPGELEVLGGWRETREVKLSREEDLESRAEAGDLEFAPEFALITTDAVNDSRDILEMFPELHLQLLQIKDSKYFRQTVKSPGPARVFLQQTWRTRQSGPESSE